MESRSFSIGINNVIVLEVTRQTMRLPVTIHTDRDITESMLIDSGAGGCFLDHDVAKEYSLPLVKLQKPIKVKNVDGTNNKTGFMTHYVKVAITIAGLRSIIRFLLTGLGRNRAILGLPWLIRYNPDINWKLNTLKWRNTDIPASDEVPVNFLSSLGGDFPDLLIDTWTTHLSQLTVTFTGETEDEESEDWYEIELSVAEYCTEPDSDLYNELFIGKLKPSDEFEQKYGNDDKKGLTESELLPKQYHEYLDRFLKKTSERYPEPREWDHQILLDPGFVPKRISPYSLNPEQTRLAKTFIEENLAKGYIIPSKSPMASPLFFVGKKDGKTRPCQDYRRLNEATIKDAFPLPNISDLLRDLQGAKFFTKLDIRWGYNNVQIKPEDRWKAAFSTPFGLYEPTVMFFGLCNSPATFQRIMNHILWIEIREGWCKVYMDDILIVAISINELRQRTKKVLDILRKEDLFLKPEKCEFEKTSIDYLGYVISPEHIAMDPKKLSGIVDWPIPRNVRQVRSFLGFGNFYRRFIAGYSTIARPLTLLTRKGQPFDWTYEQQTAFNLLKKSFTTAPVLLMPDTTKPFFLETDASAYATGAVLMQKDDNGNLHPCGFLSKTLNPTEQNYPIYDRELYALIRALKEWRIYLESANNTVTVYTDHENLKYFRTAQDLNRRQFRWSMYLSNFPLKLEHRPGTMMIISDALSRRADSEEQKHRNHNITLLGEELFLNLLEKEFASSIKTLDHKRDPGITERMTNLLDGQDIPDWTIHQSNGTNILFYKGRRYVPNDLGLKQTILKEYHDHATAGHPGAQTTYWNLTKDYWWPGMSTFVKNYVKGCMACQMMKIDRRPWKGPLQPIMGPGNMRPWTQLSMDLLTDLPTTDEGYDTLLVVVDHGLSKGIVLCPTKKTLTSIGTAELLQDQVFRRYGLAESIISDRDPRFASNAFQEWCKLLGIKSKLSTAYHPQTDGTTERYMQELEVYLSIYCLANPTDWARATATLEFTHNNRPHSGREHSPFEIIMGYQPVGLPTTFDYTKFPNVEERLELMQRWRQDAESAHEIARQRMAERIERPLPKFKTGQKVWLDMRNFRMNYNKKIQPKREGPFKISKTLGPVSYRLDLPKTWKIHNVFHPIHLKDYSENEQYGPHRIPPPPDLIEGEYEQEVDHIVNHRRKGQGYQFKLRWKGEGPEGDSWEGGTNVRHMKEMVNEYKRIHKLL